MSVEFYTVVETARCSVCGYKGEVEVPNSGLFRYTSGALAQEAFPSLSAPLREQIISGTHPECWGRLFEEPAE
jgi:hypothetical protein